MGRLGFSFIEDFKEMVGAVDIKEVAVNSTLTTNLHNLMVYFYKPTKDRYKIVTDSMSFPSDYVKNIILIHNLSILVRFGITN